MYISNSYNNGTCPSCGYCSHCGRGGKNQMYPQNPFASGVTQTTGNIAFGNTVDYKKDQQAQIEALKAHMAGKDPK